VRVLVLGAGVNGTTTAFLLAEAGHEVTVIDLQAGAGLENELRQRGSTHAGDLRIVGSAGRAGKILKRMGRSDAPIRLRARRARV
jgi:D-amino-acid dehydrogenase